MAPATWNEAEGEHIDGACRKKKGNKKERKRKKEKKPSIKKIK